MGVKLEAPVNSEEAPEIQLASRFRLGGWPNPVFCKVPGGGISHQVLVRRPGAEPARGVQMEMSAARAKRLALIEEKVGQLQPSHTGYLALPVPGSSSEESERQYGVGV